MPALLIGASKLSEAVNFVDDRLPGYHADSRGLDLRRKFFDDRIVFHAPGLKKYETSEYNDHNASEFVAVSVTGEACALNCEHCKTGVLRGMQDLSSTRKSLYEMCSELHDQGARGVLISGGSDRQGRVPLKKHIPDMIRIRQQLGMIIRVHPGLPDEETCSGLADADIDGAMVDIIGHDETIHEVYHLQTDISEYDAVLERLDRYGVPCVPHIVMGLHYGKMLGEEPALDMISRHDLRLLVLVILMPLSGTPMSAVQPPPLREIVEFFALARQTLPHKPVMLGCARPLGNYKMKIDRAAVDAGLNGIAFPAEGVVDYAQKKGLTPEFVNACCGVNW